MNSANHPIRIAKILLVTFFVGYFGFLMIPKTHALSADYTIKLCERTAYGVNYVESRKKTCELIWLKMSYDTLKTFEVWNQ